MRLGEPTLWDAFVGVVAAAGLPVPGTTPSSRRSLGVVAHDRSRHAAIWALAGQLLQHRDELCASGGPAAAW